MCSAVAEHACAGWAAAADAGAHLSSRKTSAVAMDDDRGVKLQMSASRASKGCDSQGRSTIILQAGSDRFTFTAGIAARNPPANRIQTLGCESAMRVCPCRVQTEPCVRTACRHVGQQSNCRCKEQAAWLPRVHLAVSVQAHFGSRLISNLRMRPTGRSSHVFHAQISWQGAPEQHRMPTSPLMDVLQQAAQAASSFYQTTQMRSQLHSAGD